ncbi:hypothetical protein P7C71_g3879, partial [Lecanoromycetidae sp. Uapishka_2]
MASLRESKDRIRQAINSEVDAFDALLTGKVAELERTLLDRTNTFAAEKDRYIQETETLRTKALKYDELEAQNGRLSAELEAIREYQHRRRVSDPEDDIKTAEEKDTNPLIGRVLDAIPIEEYRRVKDELDSSEHAYGRLVGAHNILQSKVRYYKDMTKQWREYTKRWVSKDPTKRAKLVAPVAPKQTSHVMIAQEQSSSSPPTPPAFPSGITLSTRDVSRSTSPQQQGTVPSNDSNHGKDAHMEQENSIEALKRDITATQSALDLGHQVDVADSTESAGDSDWIPRSAEQLRTPNKGASSHDKVPSPLPIEPDIGSSPVVVYERSLKRKRPSRGTEEDIHVHEDTALHTDRTTKAQNVKNEQPYSSPLPAVPTLPSGGVHDSLDLDDVGDRVETPKKHQQREKFRVRSSLLRLPASSSDDHGMLDDILDKVPHGGYEAQSWAAMGDKDPSLSDNATPCLKINDTRRYNPEVMKQDRRASKYAKRAQFQAHNDKIVGRIEADKQDSGDVTRPSAKKSKLLLAAAYPTPATAEPYRSRTPKGRREQEKRIAQLASPILRPTDPNAHVLPRTSDEAAPRKRLVPPSRRDRGAAHVPSLAEDGEDDCVTSNDRALSKGNKPAVQVGSEATAKASAKVLDIYHRLGTLLSEQSPTKSAIGSKNVDLTGLLPYSKTPSSKALQDAGPLGLTTPQSMPAKKSETNGQLQGRSIQSARKNEGQISNTRNDLEKGIGKRSTPQTMSRNPQSLDDPLVVRPEHEPLRARPVHRLNLDDFKINPAYSDYAYQEPIRTHEEKRAVGGCTDRYCLRCKDQRKFVEHSGYQTLRKPGESADEADQRIMEDFVGGDKTRLKSLSKEEQKETLWQAKTKEFADMYGKHRQAFPRAWEVPGLWDVDFPTTQEGEENRKAARIMEREKVEERYFEALRRGGKYVFADEVK